MNQHDKLYVYCFSGEWYASFDSQLHPIPGNPKDREEAKEKAREMMEGTR